MPEFVTTQQDATYVAPQVPEDPAEVRQAAINEAHSEAGENIVEATALTFAVSYVVRGNLDSAFVDASAMAIMSAAAECGRCHVHSPPLEPPVPETKTAEDILEELKDPKNN